MHEKNKKNLKNMHDKNSEMITKYKKKLFILFLCVAMNKLNR